MYCSLFKNYNYNNNHNKHISAAGILPFFIEDNKIKIVLFQSNRNGKNNFYEDLGGGIENKDPHISYTATREAFEESRGLISLNHYNLNNIPFIDVHVKNNKYYRSYITCFPKHVFNENYYNYNLNNLSSPDIPSFMKESFGFKFFDIDLFKQANPQEDIIIGNDIIFNRATCIIKNALSNNLFNISINKQIKVKKLITYLSV